MLSPALRRSNGYREYDDEALHTLQFIRASQALGLSLGEIREVIAFRRAGTVPCTHVQHLIDRRSGELDERIAQLERLRDELRVLSGRAATLDPRDCDPTRICHAVP